MSIRTQAEIQRLVEHVLHESHVDKPPVPIDRLARLLGAELRMEPAEGDISGFLFREGDRAIIGINKRHAPNRRRFTIAHEIGHLLLHEGQELHVDRQFRVHLRDDRSSQAIDSDEIAANQFAAELLMPATFIRRDLQGRDLDLEDDGQLRELATRYGVSLQAMTFRLTNLGLISPL
jgi:Zn-dependent peptidase ImmA (M78 family)